MLVRITVVMIHLPQPTIKHMNSPLACLNRTSISLAV